MRGNEGRAIAFGSAIRSLRRAFGLSQAELGLRVGRSQAFISAVEAGDPALRIDMAAELCDALGATLVFGVESRLLSGSERQRDAGHARCSGHVVRRLVAAGWLVNTEVQIGTRERPGWIDVLAFHPTAEILLVIEVKTELLDVGAVDRQLGWYEREAIVAARRFGWRPRMVAAALLLLATEEVDRRLSEKSRGPWRGLPRARGRPGAVDRGRAGGRRGDACRTDTRAIPRPDRSALTGPALASAIDGRWSAFEGAFSDVCRFCARTTNGPARSAAGLNGRPGAGDPVSRPAMRPRLPCRGGGPDDALGHQPFMAVGIPSPTVMTAASPAGG